MTRYFLVFLSNHPHTLQRILSVIQNLLKKYTKSQLWESRLFWGIDNSLNNMWTRGFVCIFIRTIFIAKFCQLWPFVFWDAKPIYDNKKFYLTFFLPRKFRGNRGFFFSTYFLLKSTFLTPIWVIFLCFIWWNWFWSKYFLSNQIWIRFAKHIYTLKDITIAFLRPICIPFITKGRAVSS